MPLLLGFVLVALFIWFAENIGTFANAWRYPNQSQDVYKRQAQYHDQGLIPVKYLGVDHGVNVTVGLPFVRTSVDHGTAFDIAGKGVADQASLIAAFDQMCIRDSPKPGPRGHDSGIPMDTDSAWGGILPGLRDLCRPLSRGGHRRFWRRL